MSTPLDFFSREQMLALYFLARDRGMPIESMRLDDVIAELRETVSAAQSVISDLRPDIIFGYAPSKTENASLLFDGRSLHWCDSSNPMSWEARSGNEKYFNDFSIEAQKTKNAGPIPEGLYIVAQDALEKRSSPRGWILRFFSSRWEYNPVAWGEYRIFLKPESGTNTYGRDGFFIHGGEFFGSNGCIDLAGNMATFAERFEEYEKDMRLEVKYAT